MVHMQHSGQSALSGIVNVYAALPHPKAAVTVPIIVIFAVLVFIAIARKIILLAVIAAIVCVVFLAYQSGAFTH